MLPHMPSWDLLHPLIIHFPIALLFLSPLFLAISAAVPPRKSRPYLVSAILILLLGTGSLFLSASTGKAAGELADRDGAVNAVLETHERLASETKVVFLGLSTILLGMFALPRALKRQESRLFSTLLPLAFLVLYSAGLLFLVKTAHAGGRLVHEFGVHALLPASDSQATVAPVGENDSTAVGKEE
ncbi:MAG TPA: DUF2231 domain-containing protein [Acidisarcina sp.]|nr:DUF2231 domain-containing protein [Acidisarcina sp.]